jgi:hypothetical protein
VACGSDMEMARKTGKKVVGWQNFLGLAIPPWNLFSKICSVAFIF